METKRGSSIMKAAFAAMTKPAIAEMVAYYAGPNPYYPTPLPQPSLTPLLEAEAADSARVNGVPRKYRRRKEPIQAETLMDAESNFEDSIEPQPWKNGRERAFWRAFSLGAYSEEPTLLEKWNWDLGRYDVIELEVGWPDICFAAGRRMFLTEKGFIGLGPPDCRIGNQLSILLGADSPYLLRSDGEYFELIGETYVEGIMNGLVLTEFRLGQVDIQTISI